MTLPLLHSNSATAAQLLAALQQHGAVHWLDPRLPARCQRHALAAVAAMTRWSLAEQQRMAIAGSPHHRGYSRMHNQRDFREQLHLGPERPVASPASVAAAPHWRLQGPNAWPEQRRIRRDLRNWQHRVERVARDLLQRLAIALDLDGEAGNWLGRDPYLLAKCIAYHPQPIDAAARPGVAAHVDFSLLTVTLQDQTGGLELADPRGLWQAVKPRSPAVLVHAGELLQFVTGNRLLATPHRVHNPSMHLARCSLPVFVNPSLDTTLHRRLSLREPPAPSRDGHVHAVLAPHDPGAQLAFGPAEWRRKGENRWCATCTAASTENAPTAATTAARSG